MMTTNIKIICIVNLHMIWIVSCNIAKSGFVCVQINSRLHEPCACQTAEDCKILTNVVGWLVIEVENNGKNNGQMLSRTDRTNEVKEFIVWLLAPFFIAFNEALAS